MDQSSLRIAGRAAICSLPHCWLVLVVIFTYCVHSAEPIQEDGRPDDSPRTRLIASQIREQIEPWLKPSSKFRHLSDAALIETFPDMSLPPEGLRATTGLRDGEFVLIGADLSQGIGRGHIFEPLGGDGTTVIVVTQEHEDRSMGRVIPAERAKSITPGTVLQITQRHIRTPDWPPRKTRGIVRIIDAEGAVVIARPPDERLKEVLFSIYDENGKQLIADAEVLYVGTPEWAIKLSNQRAPIAKWENIRIVPKSTLQVVH